MGDSSLASGFTSGFGSAFLQFAFERFATFAAFAWEEIRLIWGVEDELRKFQRTFWKVQALVDNMGGSSLRFLEGSKAWHMWFEDLRRLAYDAEALLDRISLDMMKNSSTENDENFAQIRSMVLSSLERLGLPHEISQMQKKLEELAKEMESLLTVENLKSDSSKISSTRLIQLNNFYSRASFIDDETVVGRVEDKGHIIDLLNKECQSGNFSTVPIVGMAGIGKTTLARLVYDDDTVCRGFEMRMWVSISIDFDAVRTTKSIIEAATFSACNLSDLRSLQLRLRGILHRRKFLLVLDDYWSENHADWDTLCSPFRFGFKGSKIVVTTRSMNVASIVSSSPGYKLGLLLANDCWTLIKQTARVEANHNLEIIGRNLAAKYEGLPLAAITVGSVLYCKSSEEEWHSILESESWDMPQSKNMFSALMLSYLHLPPHLQRCFAYCSIFPQNHEFEVEELVLLWMAEGFIQPVGARRLEDVGNDYFNDLYARSFFQECKNTPGKKTMHRLIHDMARLVCKDICVHVKYSTPNSYPLFGNACHLSLLRDDTQSLQLEASRRNERLRTFLVIGCNAPPPGEIDPKLFQKLQFLRVLGLRNIGLKELPGSIDILEYLRYLNLSENPIVRLPNSVCKLVALQTLKLRGCSRLCRLPADMVNLRKLRHLEFDVTAPLLRMPPQFRKLTSLQTLSVYIIGNIGELKDMNCLRGSLCIKNLDSVSNGQDAINAKLEKKMCLDKLELQWGTSSNNTDPLVLENLQPPQNLKQLVIKNYGGDEYPEWLSAPERNFTSIHLEGLDNCRSLPCLGQLRFLKSFVILNLHSLEYVEPSFYSIGNTEMFPSLESFQFGGMSSLREWRDVSDDAMPCLTKFTINNCKNLRRLPRKLNDPSNISGCPNLEFVPRIEVAAPVAS